MTIENGSQPQQAPQGIVEAELVVPQLVKRLDQETAALRQRINQLLYENAVQSAYIEQLKLEQAKANVEAERMQFLDQNA